MKSLAKGEEAAHATDTVVAGLPRELGIADVLGDGKKKTKRSCCWLSDL